MYVIEVGTEAHQQNAKECALQSSAATPSTATICARAVHPACT